MNEGMDRPLDLRVLGASGDPGRVEAVLEGVRRQIAAETMMWERLGPLDRVLEELSIRRWPAIALTAAVAVAALGAPRVLEMSSSRFELAVLAGAIGVPSQVGVLMGGPAPSGGSGGAAASLEEVAWVLGSPTAAGGTGQVP